MHRSAGRVLLAHVVVAVAVGACTAGHVKQGPPPNLSLESTTTNTTLDFSTVQLASVPGSTLVTVPMGPGHATLNGTVTGPGGPVGGATVHVERVVRGSLATANVTTQPDGTWSLPGILGGQFRVRSWRAPDLADPVPAIFYLSDGDTKQIGLEMAAYGATQVTASIAPDPPIIGEPAELGVAVSTSSVDNQGVIRATPRTGVTVQLFGTGQWTIDGSLTQAVNADGVATWNLTCEQLGPQPLSVVVNAADVFPLSLAPCSPVPTTTTTSTTTTLPGATTTTARGRKTTTTVH